MISRQLLLSAILVPLLGLPAMADKLPSIFDGKTLKGWRIQKLEEGKKNVWFTVDSDGVMNLQNGPEKKGQILQTEKEYKNFVMEFDFKFGKGTNDTGIYMRNDKDQIQIGISGSLKKDMTGLPYIPGKGYPINNEEVLKKIGSTLKLDDWNAMTIVAKGKNYTVWLNGIYVMSYDSDSAIEKGPIGIQLHGNREMSCQYRKITVAELN